MKDQQNEIDKASSMGGLAYLSCIDKSENQFDKETQSDSYHAWNSGWQHEKNYY